MREHLKKIVDDLYQQKKEGKITEEEYHKKAQQDISLEMYLLERVDNKEKQMMYIIDKLVHLDSLVGAIADAQLEMYNILHKGRRKDNHKTFNRYWPEGYNKEREKMIQLTTDYKENKTTINQLLRELADNYELKFEANDDFKHPDQDNYKKKEDLADEFREFLEYKRKKEQKQK